ncbi:hypothetical protein DFH09DRAFT_1363754 [Mycena vulgaris]|nr:hypothetical protein DFH09DRAFT_1363754 [Mycena vulgaris]
MSSRVPNTRSRGASVTAAPSVPSLPSNTTPAEVAASGYPDKAPVKGKTPISSLHFNKSPTNTYTGTSVKGKARTFAAAQSDARGNNSFGPLSALEEHTLDEEIVTDLIGVPVSSMNSGGGDISSTDHSSSPASSPPRAKANSAHSSGGDSSTSASSSVPNPAVTTSTSSPFLDPIGPAKDVPAAPSASTTAAGTPTVGSPTPPASKVALPTTLVPATTATPGTTVAASAPAATTPSSAPALTTAAPASSISSAGSTALPSVALANPKLQALPLVGLASPSAGTGSSATPAIGGASAPPMSATPAAVSTVSTTAAAPQAATPATPTQATTGAAPSQAARAQAARAALPPSATSATTATTRTAQAAGGAPTAGAAPSFATVHTALGLQRPFHDHVAPCADAPAAQPAALPAAQPAAQPAAPPAAPPAAQPAAPPAAQPAAQHALHAPGIAAAAAAANAAIHAPVFTPVGTAAAAAPVGNAMTIYTPPPPGGFHVYGWDAESVRENMSDHQLTKWDLPGPPKAFVYEWNAKRHDPNGTTVEDIKSTLSRILACPAPLVGPAEPAVASATSVGPFLYLIKGLTTAQFQLLIDALCWSVAGGKTLFVIPYSPSPSPFLMTIEGLLYEDTPQNAVEVATLVADTIMGDFDAQNYLALVNDAYPAGTPPMSHFLSTLRVVAIKHASHVAWNVTAQPPSLIVASNRAWVTVVTALSYLSDMHSLGTAITPPLVCGGCRSLGHTGNICPLPLTFGWNEKAPAATAIMNAATATRGRGRGGRGGGNRGARGAGTELKARGATLRLYFVATEPP